MPQAVLLWGDYRMDVVECRERANNFFGGFDGIVCESALIEGWNMRSARVHAFLYYRGSQSHI